MRIDLYQFIVPLTFLAIWALTSLFNREAQPLPPRTARPPGPKPMPARPPDWRTETYPTRPTAPGRPGLSGTAFASSTRDRGRPDDDLVILDSDTRRTPTAGLPRGGNPPAKRVAKTRAKVQPSPKPGETVTPRALSHSMARALDPQTGEPEGLTPLSLPASPLLSAPMGEAPGKVESRARDAEHVILSADDLLKLLQSPARIRESILLNELLQPPLALRGRPHARR